MRSLRRSVQVNALFGPDPVKSIEKEWRMLSVSLYDVAGNDVLLTEYPVAFAFKGTIPRRVSSGDRGDANVYGAQRHAHMLDV